MTVSEAARLIGMDRTFILDSIHAGDLKASDMSKKKKRATWRISGANLQKFIDDRETDSKKLKLIHNTKK
tara:strand:+ start:229 stop:438 length:210 start_codon:yes stop_codon:yes gene_type:complete